MPPWRAIAIAIRDSVTVSIALDTSGTRSTLSLAGRLLGRDPEAFVGRSIFEFVHPDDAPSISAIFAAFVAGEPETRVELRLLSGDGEWRWLAAKGRALTDLHTRLRNMAATANNVLSHGTDPDGTRT